MLAEQIGNMIGMGIVGSVAWHYHNIRIAKRKLRKEAKAARRAAARSAPSELPTPE